MSSNLPVPEHIKDYGHLYPYGYDMNSMLNEMNVKVPFSIIDKTMGLSTCSFCGAKYVGYESKCKDEGHYHYSAGWGNHERYKTKKEWANKCSVWGKEHVEGWTKCGHRLEWDLDEEFKKQERFFSDMRSIYLSSFAKTTIPFTPVYDHLNVISPDKAEALEKKAMIAVIQGLQAKVQVQGDVIKEIADRMQSAGHTMLNGIDNF